MNAVVAQLYINIMFHSVEIRDMVTIVSVTVSMIQHLNVTVTSKGERELYLHISMMIVSQVCEAVKDIMLQSHE